CGRRVVLGVGNGLFRQIGATVFGEKPSPGSAFRWSGVAGEDRDRHVDAGPGAWDHVSLPFRLAGKGERWKDDQQDESSRQARRAHGTISGSIRDNRIERRSFQLETFLGRSLSRYMLPRDIAERQRRSERDTGTGIVAAHDGRHVVAGGIRSEEHTSELQSRSDLVCRLLLEKKNRQ